MARVILHSKKLPIKFWAEAFNTACHIHNRITLRPVVDRESRQKFDIKGEEGVFLGYSSNGGALRVYNKRTQVIMEYINVKVVDEETEYTEIEAEEPVPSTIIDNSSTLQTESDIDVTPTDIDSNIEPAARIQKDHPVNNIIGQLDGGMTNTKTNRVDYRMMAGLFVEACFVSKVEPKDVKAALLDEHWISAM
ncbi:hypothetical protein LIER_41873 [Lithospermum erythrorhizon]|uniref:Retroviral polymerase SH3-like domain-containing protein n=1 Tax=Lithospermum erythrorhizon TaxID=34254 RepID=A0AAV3RGV9_LITER